MSKAGGQVIQRGEDALRGLSGETLKPVYLLVGSHAWLKDELAARLKEVAVPAAWRGMNVETVWADETPEAEAAGMARTPPFGSPRRLLLVRSVESYRGADVPTGVLVPTGVRVPTWVRSSGEGPAAGKARKRSRPGPAGPSPLLDCVRDPLPAVVLVLYSDRWDIGRWEEDELFDAAGQSGAVVHCAKPRGEAVKAWLGEQARSLGFGLEEAAALELIDRAGDDPLALRRELEKLANYAGKDGTVAVQDVLTLTGEMATPSVFHFLDVLFVENRPGRALSLLARLLTEMHPLQLHAMLLTQLKKMIALKGAQASGLNKWQIAALVKLPAHLVDGLGLMVRRTSSEKFAQLLRSLAGAEAALKRGRDGREVLESLVLECCR